ncbi:hypothetical protein [Fimbriiglobus ruber]|uniref:Type I restriction enzyme R protein N-terminal domain-containing protein n=1 Tax=Fimbriiglobus ruber TaxID=1908690 RepID=A0A225DJT8_9BACT|nr:hypothetical protein [Fimbriiglobus ruber]OWK38848.1 hypothetical protein FRUB_06353 [Fimbriiglobus ruber]
MAFTDYRSVFDVIRKHKLYGQKGQVIAPATDAPPFADTFRAELTLNLTYFNPRGSEVVAGEIILFPLLREIWKSYYEDLCLFTHESIAYDDDLCGYPDYFVCRVSEYGRFKAPPYLLVVEAKLDDFERAWGQCLAEMLAAQKLNGLPDQPVYGITTNGQSWEFGVLTGNNFTQDPRAYALSSLDTLGQVLHALFRACRALALTHPTPVAP